MYIIVKYVELIATRILRRGSESIDENIFGGSFDFTQINLCAYINWGGLN